MASGLILSPWSENFLADSTWSILDASAETGYPAENLVDKLPTSASKLDATTGLWLADAGAAITPKVFGIFNHNFETAMAVELRGYTAAPAGLATVPQISVALTLGALEPNNYRQDLWIDWTDATAYRYWALAVPSAGTQNPAVGEWWGTATKRSFPFGFERNPRRSTIVGTIRHPTYGGVAIKTPKEPRVDRWDGRMSLANADAQVVIDLFQNVEGTADPVLFVPNVASSYCVLGEFTSQELPRDPFSPGALQVAVGIQQLSRGLHWNV